MNLSPKYNRQSYQNNNSRSTQTQVGDTQLNENRSTVSHVNRDNFKLNAVYDVKIDSVNTLKITAKTNFYNTESDEFTTGNTTGSDGLIRNNQERLFTTKSEKVALSAGALFKHKFAKARRTLSINTNWNTLNTNANNFLKSANESPPAYLYQPMSFSMKNQQD